MKEYRKQLDKIDEEMLKLFSKRLDIIKDIANYKQLQKIKILDKQRENKIIETNLNKLDNKEYQAYYLEFIKLILKISKDLQKKLIK